MNTLVTQNIQHKRAREETLLATNMIKEYSILHKKLNTELTMSSRSRQPELIDLGDLEDISSAGTTDPKTSSPSTPFSAEPMEIIHSTKTISIMDSNIFPIFMEIKQKNETFKSKMYS